VTITEGSYTRHLYQLRVCAFVLFLEIQLPVKFPLRRLALASLQSAGCATKERTLTVQGDPCSWVALAKTATENSVAGAVKETCMWNCSWGSLQAKLILRSYSEPFREWHRQGNIFCKQLFWCQNFDVSYSWTCVDTQQSHCYIPVLHFCRKCTHSAIMFMFNYVVKQY
jgi:hypothetical protein